MPPQGGEHGDPNIAAPAPVTVPAPSPEPAEKTKPKRHPILPKEQPATGEEFLGDIIGNILLAPLLEPTTVPPPAPQIPANDLAPDPAAGMPESPLEEAPEPRQSFYDLHTGLTADIGYSFGGQNLLQPAFVGRSGHTNKTLHAGEGLGLGVSWVQLFGSSRYGLKAGINYTFNEDCNLAADSGCRYQFWHGGPDVMGLYALGSDDAPWRTLLGAGFTLQHIPVLEVQNVKAQTKKRETDFNSAIGLTLMLQWKSYSLRYTHITYKAIPIGASVDGSGFGFFFSFQFW